MAVRMLVAGCDDLAGERERLVGVVLAPAVMRGDWRGDREGGESSEDVLHGDPRWTSLGDYARCGRKLQPPGTGLALRQQRAVRRRGLRSTARACAAAGREASPPFRSTRASRARTRGSPSTR